jgi:predicted porin
MTTEGSILMQKKLLAVAVAGALAAPAVAMAQSAVTISGALNFWYESVGASGATNGTAAAAGSLGADVKTRDRIQDAVGSNIRFTVVDDIGGGLQAFGQVESAVLGNGDTRNNAINTGSNAATAGGWANRNSGVGLRGAAWGEVLLGIWDIHYNEQYAADSQIIKGTAQSSILGLMNTFGTQGMASVNTAIGARYSNVIRYQSPSWAGFNFKAAYARPTDGPVSTQNGSTPTTGDIGGAKNRVFNFAPQYANGPIFVGLSVLRDKDITVGPSTLWNGGAANVMAAGLEDVTSSRLSFAYTFPFGLKVGAIYDRSTLKVHNVDTVAAGSELKRNVWAIPISWTTGPHTIFGLYGRTTALKGNIGNAAGVSTDITAATVTPTASTTGAETVGDNTRARMISLGYQFDLSKRTNVHVNFTQITNDRFAGYDFFSNNAGMTQAGNASFGADPKSISVGLRTAF